MFNYCRKTNEDAGSYFLIPNMRFTLDDLDIGMDELENLTYDDEIDFLSKVALEKNYDDRIDAIFFTGRAQTDQRVSFAEYCHDKT